MSFDLLNTLTNDIEFCSVSRTARVIPELNKKDYAKVKGLLKHVGGEWSVSEQLFQFSKDPEELVSRIISAGGITVNKFSFYPTPKVITDFISDFTSVSCMGHYNGPVKVLEPHIGEGALAESLIEIGKKDGRKFEIDGYEIDPLNALLSQEKGFNVTLANFLEIAPNPIYDLCLMNPPFNSDEYLKHIKHAQKFLKPFGKLVSVVKKDWMGKSADNHELSSWLVEQVILDGTTSLNHGDFFGPKTFHGVGIDTMVIEIGSVNSASEIRKENCRIESLESFELHICNVDKLITEMRGLKDLDEGQREGVAQSLAVKVMDSIMKDGGFLPYCYLGDYITFLLGHAKTPEVLPERGANFDMFGLAA
jgi:hypothetical protein